MQREVGDRITLGLSCMEKGNWLCCHHPGAEGNPGQKSWPFLDLLTSLPLGQNQRGGRHEESLSISLKSATTVL